VKKKSAEIKLRLHRETLRQMEEQLEVVAGGATGPLCNTKLETICTCVNSRLC
jgi:hypothetical protein